MSAIAELTRMQQTAIDQLRSGDHSEFLVHFLTTSVLLEVSNLANANLELDAYAAAVVDVITQHAPVDQCAMAFEPLSLPPIGFSFGFATHSMPEVEELRNRAGAHSLDTEGVGVGVLLIPDVPQALAEADFASRVGEQIVAGIGKVVEEERARRGAAAARVMALVGSLDERWGPAELDQVARAASCMPDVRGCTITAVANRFGDAIVSEVGWRAGALLKRVLEVGDLELRVELRYADEPGSEQLDAFNRLLDSMAAGFDRIEQIIRMAADAETDALTGVGNRRRASKALAQARFSADLRQQPMSVLLCDLDHFKRVNDTYGHDVGDAVLVSFAGLLRQSVRAYDTVVRWGGEEFLVICPGCDHEGATSLADRLLAACSEACADALPPDDPQTTSIGIAVYPAHAQSPEMLVSKADEALYRAKREGRNAHRIAE